MNGHIKSIKVHKIFWKNQVQGLAFLPSPKKLRNSISGNDGFVTSKKTSPSCQTSKL